MSLVLKGLAPDYLLEIQILNRSNYIYENAYLEFFISNDDQR